MAWTPNTVTIPKGEPATLPVILLDKNGELFNGAGLTMICIQIKKADGSILDKTAATGFTWGVGLSCGYIYTFDLTADEVALLKTLPGQDVTIKLVYGGVHEYIVYKKYLTVISL